MFLTPSHHGDVDRCITELNALAELLHHQHGVATDLEVTLRCQQIQRVKRQLEELGWQPAINCFNRYHDDTLPSAQRRLVRRIRRLLEWRFRKTTRLAEALFGGLGKVLAPPPPE